MATIIVTNLNDSGAGSLRQAIIDAAAGDTVQFDPSIGGGTIALASELLVDKDLIIDGDEGNPVTIDAGGAANGQFRVFNVDDGNVSNQAQVTIDGVNITGGFAFGGANGNMGDGGGIFTNEALTLSNSTVTGNIASDNAGGLYVNDLGSADVVNTTISYNESNYDGGGIFAFGDTNITNSTINNNIAIANFSPEGDGGGIAVFGTTNITQSTISGNIAGGQGGGVYVKDYDPHLNHFTSATISNSTITNNTSRTQTLDNHGTGGGLASFGNTITTTVTSTIISGNFFEDSGGVTTSNDVDQLTSHSHSIQSDGNNLIGTTNSPSIFGGSDIVGVNNPGLTPLGDFGGPTQTHALQTGSAAIDAGSNPLGLTTDQRGPGSPRVVNGVADIGAFEFDENCIFGTENGDLLTGDDADNCIYGLAGDDVVQGLLGNDTLFGNDGVDLLLGADGNDQLFGGKGDDILRGGLGNDTLLGEAGNDLLNASDGDDSLLGGAGEDTLIGGENNDTLDGGLDSDSLFGGGGADSFLLRSGDGTDLIGDYQDMMDNFLLDGLTFGDLSVIQSGTDTILQAGGEDLAILQGISAATIDSGDFVAI